MLSNHKFGSKSQVGWIASAGANVNLADVATLTGHISYADGLTSEITGAGGNATLVGTDIVTNRALGGYVGLIFDLSDTVSSNLQWGFVDSQGAAAKDNGVTYTHLHTVHANIMWQPVKQMKLGWEVMYGRKTYGSRYLSAAAAGTKKNHDNIRGQFGAWFFF